jgi:hypothetical protein
VAGARICRHAVDQGWVRPVGSSRAVKVTPEGARALKRYLDLSWAAD